MMEVRANGRLLPTLGGFAQPAVPRYAMPCYSCLPTEYLVD